MSEIATVGRVRRLSEKHFPGVAWQCEVKDGDCLTTTTNAKAYADDRVRQALEQAARIVELATATHHVECWERLEEQAGAIRALKPQQPR